MPPCEPVFQVIESGRDGENLEKVSVKLLYTVLNVHYVIHIIGFHVTFNKARPDNLGRPLVTGSSNDVTTSQAAQQVRQALQHCRHYASRYVQKVIVFCSFASQTQPQPDLEEAYSNKCFVI